MFMLGRYLPRMASAGERNRRGRAPLLLVLGVLVLAGSGLFVATGTAFDGPESSLPTPKVVLYGDSLSVEAREHFVPLVKDAGAEVQTRAAAGEAPCDALPEIEADAAAGAVDVAVLQFTGNVSPCVRDNAVEASYRADAERATEMLRSAGATVVWVAPLSPAGKPGPNLVEGAFDTVVATAGTPEVRLVDAGGQLRDESGRYQSRMPCLPDEGPKQGCDPDGEIAVRSWDTVHFCPSGYAGVDCPVYASGARRLGDAMALAAVAALPG
jgi:hypothetical protein